jgi:thiamine-monophosphate kinase
MGEFELIARHFRRPQGKARVGIGDDCAIHAPPSGCELAISTDMLVQGRHFFADVPATDLGHKAMAVNLSDLAACGAQPEVFTLSIGLPNADDGWLMGFCQGMFALADQHQCVLIGGDTVKSEVIVINITVIGSVPTGRAVLRSGARVGDEIWVSGAVGEAALGLACLQGTVQLDEAGRAQCIARLQTPTPRCALGISLRGIASAMIDLSDGLAGDLQHVLAASNVAAHVDLARLPMAPVVLAQGQQAAWQLACAGGDDYELLFCAAPAQHEKIVRLAAEQGLALTCVGTVMAGPPQIHWFEGELPVSPNFHGHDHFA